MKKIAIAFITFFSCSVLADMSDEFRKIPQKCLQESYSDYCGASSCDASEEDMPANLSKKDKAVCKQKLAEYRKYSDKLYEKQSSSPVIPNQFIGTWTNNPKRSCGDKPNYSDVTIVVTESSIITPSMDESCQILSIDKLSKESLSGMYSCASQGEETNEKTTLTLKGGKLKVSKSPWLTHCKKSK